MTAECRDIDPWWVLESNNGYKVVWCPETPCGGVFNGNWSLIEDGLTWDEAVAFARRLRGNQRLELRSRR